MTNAVPWPNAERIAQAVVRRHLHIHVALLDAEDVVQDVMLRLWRASPHADGCHFHPSEIGRIAHRQLIDSLRTAHVIGDHNRAKRATPDSIDAPDFRDRTVARGGDRDAIGDDVARLAVLTERERFILVALAHGWNEAAVAAPLGISQSRVNQIKRRAQATLAGVPLVPTGTRHVYPLTAAERAAFKAQRQALRAG